MRFISILAVFLFLIGLGFAPRGASADDELSSVMETTTMPSASEMALTALLMPLTKLTDKVFPDADGIVAQVAGSGDASTDYVIVGVQFGEGTATYGKLNADLIDSWLALLDPDDRESWELDGKAILDARDAFLLAYAGGGTDLVDDSQALIRTQVSEAAA